MSGDGLSDFELESLGVGHESKDKMKTAENVVSRSSKEELSTSTPQKQKQNFKQQLKQLQKQLDKVQQLETQQRLRNQREEQRVAFKKLHGENFSFPPPVARQKVEKKIKHFDRPECIAIPEVSDKRILYDGENVKIIPRVEDDVIESEFVVQAHPMAPKIVDRTVVENTGRTIIDSDTQITKREQIISKNAAKKNRSKLSQANFAYDMQGKPLSNMNTQNMNNKEVVTPVLEPTTSLFEAPSDSDSESDLEIVENSATKEDFLKSENTQKPKLSKKAGKKLAKKNKTMEPKPKVEIPTEVPVLESKVEESVEQSTPITPVVIVSPETGEEQIEQPLTEAESKTAEVDIQTDENFVGDNDFKRMSNMLLAQEQRIADLEAMLRSALMRLDQVEKIKVKNTVRSTTKIPVEDIDETATTSKGEPVVFSSAEIPIEKVDPVRSTAARRVKFVDDGNNLKVNLKKAKTPKEQLEVVKNQLTKPESVLNKAVDQEVRDVSAERITKTFTERLQEGLARTEQKFKKLDYPEARKKVVKDASKPLGLPVKVWEKIKTSIPETEPDFESKRSALVLKKFKITFYARRQILLNKWALTKTKEQNPYLLNPIPVWQTISVLGDGDSSILNNIEKWADKASSFSAKNVDQSWAKQDV